MFNDLFGRLLSSSGIAQTPGRQGLDGQSHTVETVTFKVRCTVIDRLIDQAEGGLVDRSCPECGSPFVIWEPYAVLDDAIVGDTHE